MKKLNFIFFILSSFYSFCSDNTHALVAQCCVDMVQAKLRIAEYKKCPHVLVSSYDHLGFFFITVEKQSISEQVSEEIGAIKEKYGKKVFYKAICILKDV